MRYRLLALILTLLLTPFNIHINADTFENLIINGDFENSSIEDAFTGGIINEDSAFEGYFGLLISNPFGDFREDKIAHKLEYNYKVFLNKGNTYKISLDAKMLNYESNQLLPSESKINVSDGGKHILFEVYNLKDFWQNFSHSFFAIEDGEYSITFYFYGHDLNDIFFIDNLSLFLTRQTPERYVIQGSRNLYIPDEYDFEYTYTPAILDKDRNLVSIFGAGTFSTPNGIPTGVTLDSKKGIVKVSNKVLPGSVMTLLFEPNKNITNLESQSIEITFNKNLISNSSFDDYPYGNGWSQLGQLPSTEVLGGNRVLSLYAEDGTSYGYMTTLNQTKPVFLKAGKMYVFRAKVRSSFEYPSSDIFEDNIAISGMGDVSINIFDIGGENWKNVYSAFIPELDGEYYLNLNLYGMTKRPIYIDDVSLTLEDPYPVATTVSAPGNIYIPDYSEVYMPYISYAKNQMGEIIYDEETTLSIYPQDRGVVIDEELSVLVISPDAQEGEYTLKSVANSQPDAVGQYTITLSKNRVGDGEFEDKIAGVWWMAATPANLTILENNNQNKYAQVDFDYNTVVLNNSYSAFHPEIYYIIKGDFKSLSDNCTITAFIDDAFDDTSDGFIPIAQFNLSNEWESQMKFFSVDESVTGRLMLYLESDDPYEEICLDNIALHEAVVEALNVTINGTVEVGRTITGTYTFNSNFDETDASATRWYIGNSEEGPFDTIGAPNQRTLKLTNDMLGKYIKYEVTPIGEQTKIVGHKSSSQIVKVRNQFLDIDNPITIDDPNNNDNEKIIPKAISDIDPGKLTFLDLHSHWAKNDIEILTSAGITNGKSLYTFDPDSNITRAEFATLLVRAFNIVPISYTNRYTDVSKNDWYSDNIEAATVNDIVKGFDNGLFLPNEPITREQLIVMIMRSYYKAGGEKPLILPLIVYDKDDISYYAKEYVSDAFNIGLVKGYENNLFYPKNNATRAEAATLIARLLRYLEN